MNNDIEKRLEKLFVEWYSRMKAKDSTFHFTKDGLIYNSVIPYEEMENVWRSSRKRIIFLLKDQHQEADDKWNEDIRNWLKDSMDETDESRKIKEANRNLSSPFMRNLAYILWGLSKADNNNPWWYEEVTKHFDEVKDFFNTQPFAIVECKKQPGDGRLDDKILKQNLFEYGDLLHREIEILAPTMIVCTSQYIYDFVLGMYAQEELICIENHNSIRFHVPTGILIFCSYHPSAFRKNKNEIYEGVMYHYRAFLKYQSLNL